MQLCKGKKANDIWVFVLNFSTIVPPDGRQTLHPYQLVLKSLCLSYFFLQCMNEDLQSPLMWQIMVDITMRMHNRAATGGKATCPWLDFEKLKAAAAAAARQ